MEAKEAQEILERIYQKALSVLFEEMDITDAAEIATKTLVYRPIIQTVIVGLIRVFQGAGLDINDESEELFFGLTVCSIEAIFKPENRSVLEYKQNTPD